MVAVAGAAAFVRFIKIAEKKYRKGLKDARVLGRF